ncbi:MAG: type II toxin-antitoxin system prevent-host-death family antitoxin [Methylobacter sp.]|nr:type II toxin-antitoxin system prevent-host-death family antitoxin [Methylobacter sp.]
MQVNMLEAKNRLSSLIAAAEQGEEVLIARNGLPVAKIVKYSAPKVNLPGAWKGQITYVGGWNSPETNVQVERLFSGADDASAA